MAASRPRRAGAAAAAAPAPSLVAWVVVLGEFGRSPRMQYHALSLADQVGAAARGGSRGMGGALTRVVRGG